MATILTELRAGLTPKRLAEAAALVPLPWAQRLGHLLDSLGAPTLTGPLYDLVRRRAKVYVHLSPSGKAKGGTRDTRWRVWVNIKVHAEA